MAQDDKPESSNDDAGGGEEAGAPGLTPPIMPSPADPVPETPEETPARKAAKSTAKKPAKKPAKKKPAKKAAAKPESGGADPVTDGPADAAESASPPPPDYAAGSEGPGEDDADEGGLRGDYRSRADDFRRGAEEATARMRGAAETAQTRTREQVSSARATIGESEDRTIAIAVYVLYLAIAITSGIGAIAGVILAYFKRDEADAVIASHLEFQIRTFWIGLAAMVVGLVLTIVFIGVLILIALAVWWLIRNVVGLIRLIEGKPMPDPKAWLI